MPNGLIAKYLGLAEGAILMNFRNLVYVLISYSLVTYICVAPTAYWRLTALNFRVSYALQAQFMRLPNGQGSPTSNTHHCRVGWVAQPAIHTIAEWAGGPNQQCTRLPSGLGGPTSNPHDCRMGCMAQPAILS